MRQLQERSGATLIELLVALVVLGITGGVALVAWPRSNAPTTASGSIGAIVAEARRAAITTGRPQRVHIRVTREEAPLDPALPDVDGQLQSFVALPDGGVIAKRELMVDRLSGRLRQRPRTQ